MTTGSRSVCSPDGRRFPPGEMKGRYYVGEWLVEPEQSRLVRGSESQKPDPKAIQLFPSSTLPYGKILDRLRALTNQRVVPDETPARQ